MRNLPYLGSLLLILKETSAQAHFDEFLEDIIAEWDLRSPTILLHEERLNLTVRTVEMVGNGVWRRSENGSWNGGVGVLHRKEADISSNGMGVLLERAIGIDYPIPVICDPATLFAPKPTRAVPNMWVYLRVFGVIQWAILFLVLIAYATTMSIMPKWRGQVKDNSKRNSAIRTYFLFTIQNGEHANTELIGTRIMSLTASMQTLHL